ncbi:MAG: TonB-dependent receptor, partial [Ignavibacteria bacterium]|nr:TonB-dependent receptor [Ignavibacteria bacterium]
NSQQTGTLRGSVLDSLSGEALPFTNILLENTSIGVSTDAKGYFVITGIPANQTYSIKVSFMGYDPKILDLLIKADEITRIQVLLSPGKIQLQDIEKVGNKYKQPNETDLGLQKIDIRKIESLPKGVETDIFRSLQFLPGVQSTGDVSARYYVRGSSSNQNLILYNGVTVYNPYHALGLFSIIDPEIINSLEFYKGGFPSEYGGKLSSVLNLISKDGNKNNFSGSAAVSFLTAKTSFEGPLPFGSFIITARKSLFSDVLKKFLNYKNAPFEFHDLAFKVNYTSSKTKTLTKFNVHGFNSADKLINDTPKNADYKWSNNIYGANLFQEWENIPLFSQSSLSISSFNGEVIPKESITKPRKNIVNDITLKSDFTYINQNRNEVYVGINLTSIETELFFENLQAGITNIKDRALQFALYGKYKFLQLDSFGADIGTRLNVLTLTQQRGSIVEPRVSLTYNFLPNLIIKGAWGIYTQELITLTNENEVISIFEPWVITPDYLKPSEAIHYVLGLEFISLSNFNFTIETYYKLLKNTAEQNDKKANASDPDFIQGKGESYGSEFMFNYQTPLLQATASYSLSWAYKEIDGWVSYPKYDSRHSLNLNLTLNFGKGWESSISWFFNSGLPFTQIIGYY